ncbi:hypothetical protein JI664_21450 [Rhodobacter sp. NTK016B]|uniref:hypothetical protein n=1 Tax=Rhodobacter sp. NTK016B TaxID=2759676 RepID=UPI001A8C106B|nr:hypothetical protein [Rhodobacter sp. NTK016B]MBN8294553.1 hypothetical protein [Rhodobacter sp. NTK016B]
MTIHLTDYSLFKKQPSTYPIAHMLQRAAFSHTFTTAFTAASDILEIGVFPARAKACRATLIGEGLGAITADVGFMTGDIGSKDAGRTSDDVLFDGVSVNDEETEANVLTLMAIEAAETDRAVGVKFSGDIAAGASKKVHVVLEYFYD